MQIKYWAPNYYYYLFVPFFSSLQSLLRFSGILSKTTVLILFSVGNNNFFFFFLPFFASFCTNDLTPSNLNFLSFFHCSQGFFFLKDSCWFLLHEGKALWGLHDDPTRSLSWTLLSTVLLLSLGFLLLTRRTKKTRTWQDLSKCVLGF